MGSAMTKFIEVYSFAIRASPNRLAAITKNQRVTSAPLAFDRDARQIFDHRVKL